MILFQVKCLAPSDKILRASRTMATIRARPVPNTKIRKDKNGMQERESAGESPGSSDGRSRNSSGLRLRVLERRGGSGVRVKPNLSLIRQRGHLTRTSSGTFTLSSGYQALLEAPLSRAREGTTRSASAEETMLLSAQVLKLWFA